ncbi:carbohydrate-binding protein [Aporhodopirellula aestuarii]|uniref:Uncharacterized protein n=1 Tax=Aporhodopirellula aestuarii TaxID=2950107 RepID=A0ABT0U628_9BACT|nr:hypothetical protein [Aporhodopirellula aestuarii]MCM2372374.1 hypothetical protein [Aporhodopirellula aestuarii]
MPTLLLLSLLFVLFTATTCCAAEPLNLRMLDQLTNNERLKIVDNRILLVPGEDHTSIQIPRVFAALKSANWLTADENTGLTVAPEPDYWLIRWDDRPAGAKEIELVFDTAVQFGGDLKASEQLGDGRINMHAFEATTTGEKLRYEPQPYKNTVGFWIDPGDFAAWTINVEQPGNFNVGLLQGCGAGQGGSQAVLSVSPQVASPHAATPDNAPVSELEFEVVETGHFQNFVWRNIGEIAIAEPGVYTVKLRPQRIAVKALMDVRQIQLVRRPSP